MESHELYDLYSEWVVSPAVSFQEWLDVNDFDLEQTVENVDHVKHYVVAMFKEVLDLRPICVKHATLLEDVTGISANMWLNFEQNYRMGLEAGKYDVSPDILRRN